MLGLLTSLDSVTYLAFKMLLVHTATALSVIDLGEMLTAHWVPLVWAGVGDSQTVTLLA